MNSFVLSEVLRVTFAEFELPIGGIHGVLHWGRVIENGIRLAQLTGADQEVVVLFGAIHDCRRLCDGYDPNHGARAADSVKSLQGSLFDLSTGQFELLQMACRNHSLGLMTSDVTVQTCWDSDRLDLGRVGIRPDPNRLCTNAAKQPEILRWAMQRSESSDVPNCVRRVWDEWQLTQEATNNNSG